MNRNARIFCFLLLALAALGGCSSKPETTESKKAGAKLDTIEGKIQVVADPSGSGDSVLNPGGTSVYLWEGSHRYRLFFSKAADVVHGSQYRVEGVNAQKVIDEIGDPAQGKNGYPLQTSCAHVVRMAWGGLAFDEVDLKAGALGRRVARYPARPVFLVVRIEPVTPKEKPAAPEEKEVPTVTVAAEKQRASLIEGSTVLTAPLWEPAGGTERCKVIIDSKGEISELETGKQLCEAVPWAQFRYKPLVQGGHPVNVRTEVEVRFEPHK